MTTTNTKEEYNREPVYFCKSCLSLAVKNEGEGSYCTSCGNSSIGRTTIDLWAESYRQKYGKDFLTDNEVPDEKCKHCKYKNDGK